MSSGSNNCPQASINASTVRVGLVGPHWAGPPPDLDKEIIVNISPQDKIDNATFVITNASRAQFSEKSRQTIGDSVEITFTIKGLAKTPDTEPNGDANFEVRCSGSVIATCSILVVIPKTQTHSVGPATIKNTAVIGVTSTVLTTEFTSIVTITIKDQFDVLLSDVYDGPDRVAEKFTLASPSDDGTAPYQLPSALKVWGFINIPLNDKLQSGKKEDETGFIVGTTYGLVLTPAEKSLWESGTLTLSPTGNNVPQMMGTAGSATYPNGWTAKQEIRVVGWAVTPDYVRQMIVTGGPYGPPVPFQCIDS